MIRPGDNAPGFEVPDVKGKLISTVNFDGDYLLVSFMRGASCPFCHLRHMELDNREEKMRRLGVTTYMIYHADQTQLKENMERIAPSDSCRMVPDPDLYLHNLYDTKQSYLGTLLTFFRIGALYQTIIKRVFSFAPISDPPLIPADFLIDRNGKILISHYGRDYTDNVSIDGVFEVIEEIEKNSIYQSAS